MSFGAKNEFGSLVTTSYLHKNMLHFCPIHYLQLQLYLLTNQKAKRNKTPKNQFPSKTTKKQNFHSDNNNNNCKKKRKKKKKKKKKLKKKRWCLHVSSCKDLDREIRLHEESVPADSIWLLVPQLTILKTMDPKLNFGLERDNFST